jgi:hypothetical protein
MEPHRRVVAYLFRAGNKAMIAGSLALFAASLFLPFAYGAEMFGLVNGLGMLEVWYLFAFRVPDIPLAGKLWLILGGVAYLASPLSLLAARLRPWLAASLVAFGLLLPIWILASEGLFINAFLRVDPFGHVGGRYLNTGCLCLLVANLLMLAAWIDRHRTGVTGKERACPDTSNDGRRA